MSIMDTITDPSLVPTGMRVQAYWNLHRHCFSVVALEGEHKGRVVAHLPEVRLADARFTVRPSGRERVRREGRKNVHAFVRGRWQQSVPNLIRLCVTYNPYKHETFVDGLEGKPVHAARYAVGTTTAEGRPVLSII